MGVDGAYTPPPPPPPPAAGAQVLVAGSDVFKAQDRKERIAQLRGEKQ